MEIVIRASVIFWFLWLVVRGTGKRSLAELTPLDLLLVVVIGDFVQQGVTGEDMSVSGAMIAVSVFVVWTLLADSVSRRSARSSAILNGEPVIVDSGRRPFGGPHEERTHHRLRPGRGRTHGGHRRSQQGLIRRSRDRRPILVHHQRGLIQLVWHQSGTGICGCHLTTGKGR
jgi:hypothetical protein